MLLLDRQQHAVSFPVFMVSSSDQEEHPFQKRGRPSVSDKAVTTLKVHQLQCREEGAGQQNVSVEEGLFTIK